MRPAIKQIIDSSAGRGIRLADLQIDDGELAEILSYIVQKHPDVKQLGFPRNNLTDEGCKILTEQLIPLTRFHQLIYLNLEENLIGEKGFMHLCNGLMSINPKFSLAFRGNTFKDSNKMFEIEESAKATSEKANGSKPMKAKP